MRRSNELLQRGIGPTRLVQSQTKTSSTRQNGSNPVQQLEGTLVFQHASVKELQKNSPCEDCRPCWTTTTLGKLASQRLWKQPTATSQSHVLVTHTSKSFRKRAFMRGVPTGLPPSGFDCLVLVPYHVKTRSPIMWRPRSKPRLSGKRSRESSPTLSASAGVAPNTAVQWGHLPTPRRPLQSRKPCLHFSNGWSQTAGHANTQVKGAMAVEGLWLITF